MAVLRESPWYQEILREGQQQGQQQGRQEGRQEGELALIIRLLNRRIGSLEPQMQERLQGVNAVPQNLANSAQSYSFL